MYEVRAGTLRIASYHGWIRKTPRSRSSDSLWPADRLLQTMRSVLALSPLVGLFASSAAAQDFQLSELTSKAEGVRAAVAADLDGDGDLDVLSASPHDAKLAWYENQGGGAFRWQQVLSDQLEEAVDVLAADLDGDGDLDVVCAADDDDAVILFENLGAAQFAGPVVLSQQLDGASAIRAADLDGDSDLDLVIASAEDDQVLWLENLGGGSFGPEQILTSSADGACSVDTADLDGDGELTIFDFLAFQDAFQAGCS